MKNYLLEAAVGGVMSAGTTLIFTHGNIRSALIFFGIGAVVALIGGIVRDRQQGKQPEAEKQ